MKKVVRLTESDLSNIIYETINELGCGNPDRTARRDLKLALLPNIQYNNYKGTATFNGGIGPFKNGEKLLVTIDKENDWLGAPMISIHPIVNGGVDKKRGIQFFSSPKSSSAEPSELYMIGDASDDGWASSSYRPCSISDACRYLPTNIAKEFVEASRQYVEHMTSDDDDIVNNFTYQDWVDAIGQNLRDYESGKSNSLDDDTTLRKWYDAKKSMNKNNKLDESIRRAIRKYLK